MSEILKKHSNSNYITMCTQHLLDKELSLKAKGLLSVMFTLPNDWNYSVNALVELTGEGRTVIRTTLQELERHNYLFRKRLYTKGKLAGTEYHIYEIPTDEETRLRLEKLTLENLTLENQPNPINTTNINSYNKELIKDTNSIKEPIKDIKNNKGSSVQKGKKELFKTKDSVQEIVDYYQQNCPDLPAIKTVSEQRKQAVKKILQKYGPDTVKEVLDKAQASKFLTGKSNNGRTWKCYFSWIFKEENFIKIWEGNYDEDFTSKKKDVFSEHGKVKSIPVDRQKKQKYLEELRKNGEQTDY